MEHEFTHFVHANHLPIFSEVAQLYNCHILVRKTGIDSIYWIGRNGYTGKRGDMKAKTAKKNVANALMVNHGEQVNIGQVTHEPVLAFFARRRGKAYAEVLIGADKHRRSFAEA